MKIAAAYIRVSTEDQLEFSPDSQLKALKNYAEKNCISLPDKFIFMDEGISGRNAKKRPAFNKMISIAKSKPKPFDEILVWKYSRFARNREDSVVYKSMLRKELDIDVVSISEDVGDDKMSVLFEAMIEAMDEYYSINLAEEVKRGMTEKAKRGGVLSIAPFGYEIKNGKFSIIPDEAKIISKVFLDYNNGKGFLTIAKELNLIGVKTHRGNKIENRTVEYWLNNPVYAGKSRWNPNGAMDRNYCIETLIIVDGVHEAIIDNDIWIKTQEKIKSQKQKNKKYYTSERSNLSHWLVGIVRCGICGAVLSNRKGYLECSKKTKGLCKGNGVVKVEILEKNIVAELSKILVKNLKINFIKKNKPDLKLEMINNCVKQIKKLEIKLNRAKSAYEDGIDTISEYKKSKKKFEYDINNIKKQIKREEENEECEFDNSKTKRLLEIITDNVISNVEKNKMMRIIVKEIIKTGKDGKTIKIVFWE